MRQIHPVDFDAVVAEKENLERECTALKAQLAVAREALEKCVEHAGLNEPGFKDRTPLSFAASLGLIDMKARAALAALEGEK